MDKSGREMEGSFGGTIQESFDVSGHRSTKRTDSLLNKCTEPFAVSTQLIMEGGCQSIEISHMIRI